MKGPSMIYLETRMHNKMTTKRGIFHVFGWTLEETINASLMFELYYFNFIINFTPVRK